MIYNIVDIEEAKEKIKPELFNHPQFMKEWKDAYDYMSERSGKSNITIKVSEDGKGISIQEQYVAKGINPEIKNNSELSNTTVILDDNGGLILEKSNGLCIEVKDYIDITCKKADRSIDYEQKEKKTKELEMFSSILSTSYSSIFYDAKGIEMSSSSFGDTYPMSNLKVGDLLSGEVLSESHKPQKWSHNACPENPRFVNNAYSKHTYRDYENLGLAHTLELDGISQSLRSVPKEIRMFQSKVWGIYPELLSYNHNSPAVATKNPDPYSSEKMIGCNEYEGVDLSQISKDVALKFEEQIKSSKTKEESPEIYVALQEKVQLANARYKTTEAPDQQQEVSEQAHTR